MKIGFIGTGHITKSVIHGILGSKLKIRRIIVSKRNNKISSSLKRKSKKILVLNNNQEIINNSNWIFLSVTPEVGHKILPELKFKKNQTIVSFISTIKMKDLKIYTNMKSKILITDSQSESDISSAKSTLVVIIFSGFELATSSISIPP